MRNLGVRELVALRNVGFGWLWPEFCMAHAPHRIAAPHSLHRTMASGQTSCKWRPEWAIDFPWADPATCHQTGSKQWRITCKCCKVHGTGNSEIVRVRSALQVRDLAAQALDLPSRMRLPP